MSRIGKWELDRWVIIIGAVALASMLTAGIADSATQTIAEAAGGLAIPLLLIAIGCFLTARKAPKRRLEMSLAANALLILGIAAQCYRLIPHDPLTDTLNALAPEALSGGGFLAVASVVVGWLRVREERAVARAIRRAEATPVAVVQEVPVEGAVVAAAPEAPEDAVAPTIQASPQTAGTTVQMLGQRMP